MSHRTWPSGPSPSRCFGNQYRVAWAVQDVAAYGEEVTASPWLGQESRRAAVDGFMILFEPGEIVDIAAGR